MVLLMLFLRTLAFHPLCDGRDSLVHILSASVEQMLWKQLWTSADLQGAVFDVFSTHLLEPPCFIFPSVLPVKKKELH